MEIKGKKGTPYEGGVFGFELKLKKKTLIPTVLKLTKEDLKSEKTVAELKRDLYEMYDIVPIDLQLNFKGHFLNDRSKLKSIDYDLETDHLVVDGMMAGPSPWIEGDAYCYTIIWHPNIDPRIPPGSQNFNFGGELESNANLCDFIVNLKKMVHLEPETLNFECALNKKAVKQFQEDIAKFNIKAKNWVNIYAQKDFYREIRDPVFTKEKEPIDYVKEITLYRLFDQETSEWNLKCIIKREWTTLEGLKTDEKVFDVNNQIAFITIDEKVIKYISYFRAENFEQNEFTDGNEFLNVLRTRKLYFDEYNIDWVSIRDSLNSGKEEFEFIFKNDNPIRIELWSSKDPIYPNKIFCKFLKFSIIP